MAKTTRTTIFKKLAFSAAAVTLSLGAGSIAFTPSASATTYDQRGYDQYQQHDQRNYEYERHQEPKKYEEHKKYQEPKKEHMKWMDDKGQHHEGDKQEYMTWTDMHKNDKTSKVTVVVVVVKA